MPIDNPTALVEEFKKSGEFDRVRRELLAQFQQDEAYATLKERVEDIARQRLSKDQMMQYMPQETVYKELAQEVDRYPIVERVVTDVRILSDPTFLANVESSLQKILRDDKGGKSSSATKEDQDNGSEKTRTPVTQTNTDPIEKPEAVQDAHMGDSTPEQQKSTTPSESLSGNPPPAPPAPSPTTALPTILSSAPTENGGDPTPDASKMPAMDPSILSQPPSLPSGANVNSVVNAPDYDQQPMDIDTEG